MSSLSSAVSDNFLMAAHRGLSDKPDMAELLKDRVSRLIADSGKKIPALSLEGGFKRTLLYDVIGGRQRKLSGDKLNGLAKVLGVTIESLMSGDDGTTLHDCRMASKGATRAAAEVKTTSAEVIVSTVVMRPAAVDGKVEAGSWREVDDFNQDDPRFLDVPVDEEFPDAGIRVFEIAGDSMNDYARAPLKPGALAICLDFDDVEDRMPLRNGMVVVVERTSSGGQFVERSIKEVEIHDGHYEFHPRSTNPAHKPIVVPLNFDADDGVTIRVKAVLRRVTTDTIRF